MKFTNDIISFIHTLYTILSIDIQQILNNIIIEQQKHIMIMLMKLKNNIIIKHSYIYKHQHSQQSYKQITMLIIIWCLAFFSIIHKTKAQASCNPSHNKILLADGTCVCQNGFFDAGTPSCSACSTPCLTCVSTATTCTSCDSTLHLTISGSTCICMDGWVAVSGVCQPCHYSCATCNGALSTNCLSCNTSVRLYDTGALTCPCLNTTYDDSTMQSCQPCHANCLWCTTGSSSSCTACNPVLFRLIGTTNPGSCICQNGYYDPGVPLCAPCDYTCATCLGTSTSCTTCNTALFRSIIGTSCICISHYYDISSPTCAMCSPRCGNCVTFASTCLTCNNTLRILTGTNCPCISGYYEESATITCLPCTSYCLTCQNTSSTCLSCYGFGNRYLYNATCICFPGYYDNGTIFCQVCPYSCLTCVGPSPLTCTSCHSTTFRTLFGGQCVCDTGYFDNGSLICQACSYTCQTCVSSPIICTSCSLSFHRTLVSSTDCNCSIGYYDNGVDALCAGCHYSCITCFGGINSQCYTCQINRNYANYTCPCFDGLYQLSQICYNCDPICATCINSATYCTSCPISRTLFNNTCICAVGYYISGTSCLPCLIQCLTCVLTATACTACNPIYNTILSGSSCICADGYYLNSSSLICQLCHFTCLTCQISNDSNNCLTCSALNFRTFVPNSCQCMVGYFDAGVATCMRCSSVCTSCYGSTQYNCTGCQANYILIGSYCKSITVCLNYLYEDICMNQCPAGSYGITAATGNLCLQCINNCRTCRSSTYCLTCLFGSYLDTNTNTCINYCSIGYYMDNNGQCIQCPSNCLICAYRGRNICTQCTAGFILQGGGYCVSTCQPGYLFVLGRCHRCEHNCATCNFLSNSGCLTCLQSYNLLNGTCYSTCPQGYIPQNSNCVICPQQCTLCMFNSCLACSEGYYLSNSCKPLGFFENSLGQLIKCHPNCQSCTDVSFSSCVMCSSYRGDSSQLAISGYCECKQQSIDTGDGLCDTEIYQSIAKANQVLIGSTQSIIFFNTLVSIVTTNAIPIVNMVNYLQTYSTLYYLNASAVLQTNLILSQYRKINFITFYRMSSVQLDTSSNSQRLLVAIQSDQSLFLRGQSWQYLSQWGFPALIINFIIWSLTLLMIICKCCCVRKSNKITNLSQEQPVKKELKDQKIQINQFLQQKQANTKNNSKCPCTSEFFKYSLNYYISYIKNAFHESIAIIIYFLTYNQIFLYGIFSFKDLFKLKIHEIPFQIEVTKAAFSCVMILYYFFYLIRLFIGCYRMKITQNLIKKQSLRILFHGFRKNVKSKLSNMFVPLIFLRNIILSTVIVILAYNPTHQAISCLSLTITSMLINLCICPYEGANRILFHITELILVIQIGILTYTVALPQQSRIPPSKALTIINFLQVAVISFVGLWMSIQLIRNKFIKKTSSALPKNKNIVVNQQSLSNIAQEQKKQYIQKIQQKQLEDAITLRVNLSPFQNAQTEKIQQSPKKQKKYSKKSTKTKTIVN